jgi:hypothetical protein
MLVEPTTDVRQARQNFEPWATIALSKEWSTSAWSWKYGPLWKNFPEFGFLVCEPKTIDGAYLYLTMGASAWRGEGGEMLEFMLATPNLNEIHFETLSMVAWRHASITPPLKIYDTLDIGQGWYDGSQLTCLLMELPGFLPEPLISDEAPVVISWCQPITASEKAYLDNGGAIVDLKDRFCRRKIDILAESREGVV